MVTLGLSPEAIRNQEFPRTLVPGERIVWETRPGLALLLEAPLTLGDAETGQLIALVYVPTFLVVEARR